jgi:hypothetical protein
MRSQILSNLMRSEFGEDEDHKYLSNLEEKEEVASILPVERLASCKERTVFVTSHFASLDDDDCDLCWVTGTRS